MQTDLLGQNILNYTHSDDQAFFKQQLIPKNLETLFESQLDENGEPRARTEEEETEIDRKLKEDKRYFTIRYKFTQDKFAKIRKRNCVKVHIEIRIIHCFYFVIIDWQGLVHVLNQQHTNRYHLTEVFDELILHPEVCALTIIQLVCRCFDDLDVVETTQFRCIQSVEMIS